MLQLKRKLKLYYGFNLKQDGFTLIEVLVSMVIVALVVTVYFQLLSSGMKLEYKSRQHTRELLVAQQVFESILQKDVRSDDFKWEGEDREHKWTLDIKAIDIQEENIDEDILLKKPSELYQLTFKFFVSKNGFIKLIRYVRFDPNFFSEEFKNKHLEKI